MSDDASTPLASPKGKERADRLRARIVILMGYRGWQPKAEASALRWILARIEHVERRLEAPAKISQAQAVAIIEAWRSHDTAGGGRRDSTGRAVLDGLDLEELGIR